MNYLQNKKLLLALFALSALFLMPTESRATVVGVCTDVPGQSGAGSCTKSVNITGNLVTIVLTNTNTVAQGGFITADAFNLAPNTGVVAGSFTTTAANFSLFTPGPFSTNPSNTLGEPRNALIGVDNDFEGGMATGGLGAGQTATFTFTLTALGANTETSIFLSEAIRFQGFANGDSDKTLVQITTPPPAAIPEPTTMLLLGSGLAGVAARMRRRRKGESE